MACCSLERGIARCNLQGFSVGSDLQKGCSHKPAPCRGRPVRSRSTAAGSTLCSCPSLESALFCVLFVFVPTLGGHLLQGGELLLFVFEGLAVGGDIAPTAEICDPGWEGFRIAVITAAATSAEGSCQNHEACLCCTGDHWPRGKGTVSIRPLHLWRTS